MKHSHIEWCHHTFNGWWGCFKVSPACDNCYANSTAKQYGHEIWGKDAPRRILSESHWNQPFKWDREARLAGVRRRVFCASMSDVFEGRADLDAYRKKLWSLIKYTPNLDWQMLTKRPGNIAKMAPAGGFPENVWLGCSVESEEFTGRIKQLLKTPATVRFLSCEPLLSDLDLSGFLGPDRINWVIAGGESGPNARPTDPAWFRSLRDQCLEAGVPFFFKQWGRYQPIDNGTDPVVMESGEKLYKHSSKKNPILHDLEWKQFPDELPFAKSS